MINLFLSFRPSIGLRQSHCASQDSVTIESQLNGNTKSFLRSFVGDKHLVRIGIIIVFIIVSNLYSMKAAASNDMTFLYLKIHAWKATASLPHS